jgi:hypothetical protein
MSYPAPCAVSVSNSIAVANVSLLQNPSNNLV